MSLSLACAALAVGLAACTNDGGSSGACSTIGKSGGIVSSEDGTLSLSFRPNSLSEDTEVCISPAERPPKGPPFVYGQAYRVTPDIDVDVNISVTYRTKLPDDTSLTRIGVIRREDFDAGVGRWLSLPLTRLEPANELVAGTDTRISMFYGLLDDGGDGMIDVEPGDTSGDDTTTGGPSDTDTNAGAESSGTSGAVDPSETGGTDETTGGPGETGDETTGGTDDESTGSAEETGDSDTGMMPVGCDNLPMPPFDIQQIATVSVDSAEDLAMTGNGTFVLADGDTFVEMDAEGNSDLWVAGLPFDEDILGVRFDAYGTLYASMGLNSSEIWTFTQAGGEMLLDTGLQLPNAIHIDSTGMIWVSDYFGDTISRITADGSNVETVINTNANSANGVFFDENRNVLYWANYQSSQIWSAPVTAGVVGAPAGVVDLEGFSDGITMDECGNLYVVDQGGVAGDTPCRIDRIPLNEAGAQDGDVVEIAPAGSLGNGCANAQFGYGFGDENDQAMFVTGQQGGVYRVEAGVSGYPLSIGD